MTAPTNPRVSVLADGPNALHLLDAQTARGVELVTWRDEEWADRAARLASEHGWTHVRVASKAEALDRSSGDYVIGWNMQAADTDALEALANAAEREPDKRGALAANFDPAILWRRDEFDGSTGRSGLAAAAVHAVTGEGVQVHPD